MSMFPIVHCSQCGEEFGPRESGYSHCEEHEADAFAELMLLLYPETTQEELARRIEAGTKERALTHLTHHEGNTDAN